MHYLNFTESKLKGAIQLFSLGGYIVYICVHRVHESSTATMAIARQPQHERDGERIVSTAWKCGILRTTNV